MTDFASIIQKTKKPLAVCAVLVLAFASYTVDRLNTHIIVKPKQGKTLEEIMQAPADKTQEYPWDTEWESKVVPIKEHQ